MKQDNDLRHYWFPDLLDMGREFYDHLIAQYEGLKYEHDREGAAAVLACSRGPNPD